MIVALLSCSILLGHATSVWADPKPLSKEEQAKVDKAIDKGIEFLKLTQTKRGDFLNKAYPESFLVGQCALPAYALLEAGVPADDPVLEKAAKYIRPRALTAKQTYDVSLAILFLDRLGNPKDENLIRTLGLRLIAAQHRTGGWGYGPLPILDERNEQALSNCLGELNKRMKEKKRDKALEGMEMPLAFRLLTVFQTASSLPWAEPELDYTSLEGRTDNSNTQFAMLGLWAAQRHGLPMLPTFEIMVERFERFQVYPSGLWTYSMDSRGSTATARSMICAGLMGLAIGRGLHLSTSGLPGGADKDFHVLKGLAALRRHIGTPIGHMNKHVPWRDVYFLWSLERVGMLYNLPTIGDEDWYRWGAESLVTNQMKHGGWPGTLPLAKHPCAKGDYGAMVNTSFALLFLKRSHPMKDLTPKLPVTGKELNEGIARLRPDDKFPFHRGITPTQSKNLNRSVTTPSESGRR